jgi:hypothetical protein
VQSLGQRIYREKLAKLISKTSLLDVVGMSWCAWAIQNGHADIARRYMHFPPEATDGSAGARFGIYPWQLETLVNEALVAPHLPDVRGRGLVTEEFSTIYRLVKLVQRIEEADDRKFLSGNDVLYELHRLTQRQFEWQRGFANQPRFYRAVSLFGQGAAGAYFEEQFGCAVTEFIEAAFFLFAGSANSATRRWKDHGDLGGVSAALLERVLDRISLDADRAPAVAGVLRAHGDHIGYKPSVLRRYPILRFGQMGEDAMAPIPPLILQRVTSGLYLDIVDGGGAIWEDVGRRFENFCIRYLEAMLIGYAVESEERYGPKGRSFDTPDILVSRAGAVRLVVECKAKRMPVEARFSGDPVGNAAVAYGEIAKGVFQIWRFFSHARRGLLPQPVAPDCVGIVLTADPWLVMWQKLHPEVMAIASRMANEKDPKIEDADRRRVPIVLIDDLEYALQHASVDEFLGRVASLARDPTGWEWSLVHGLESNTMSAYPFTDELSDLLPRIYARDQAA